MSKKKLCVALAAMALGLAAAAPSSSEAAIVYDTGTNTSSIPGLTGSLTHGALMDGLSVTATFASGFSETLLWADTGPTSGGVSGNGWSLSLTGDSFFASWNFGISRSDQLTSLILDGLNSFTVFDRTWANEGTPGSGSGRDFQCSVCGGATVHVTYDYQISVGDSAAVGDLWQVLTIDFGQNGPRQNWTFFQDTDNDSRITQVSEPATVLLFGLSLAMLGVATRRRQRVVLPG